MTSIANQNRETIRQLTLVGLLKESGIRQVGVARWFRGRSASATRVFCEVSFLHHDFRIRAESTGYGGGGYDKEAKALEDCLRQLGYDFEVDGLESALFEVVKCLGYDLERTHMAIV